jgi:cyanophycinase
MRRILTLLACALLATLAATWPRSTSQPGALIVVGGGGTPARVVARAVALSGGESSVVAILPHASSRDGRGVGSAEMFLEAGAGEAFVLEELGDAATREQLARATLVWMPGGSQNRLMEAVRSANLGTQLRAMHQRGVAFGGTSAGAAVQSSLMITGEAELESVVARGTKLDAGLGLWEAVIVDQHALKRRRFHRLLSAVLDHPKKVGVAIDERTAVVLQGTHFEVLGESSVLVIDARDAEVEGAKPGEVHAARGLGLHILRAGMRHELDRED